MRSRLAIGAFVACVTLAPLAHAEVSRTEDPDAKKEYLDKIQKGEAAFVAKDMAGALSSFQDAIKSDPGRMLGLYRVGETQLAQGKFDEAVATLQQALGKKGTNQLKGKVMFLIGVTFERAHIGTEPNSPKSLGALKSAKEAFGKYLEFIQANQDAKGYAQIAAQHVKVIDRRMKDEVDYAAVRERILKRQKETEAEAAENAKKDKLNK
jgi:tetratricopeptide (TPR) repeat protein